MSESTRRKTHETKGIWEQAETTSYATKMKLETREGRQEMNLEKTNTASNRKEATHAKTEYIGIH